MKFSSRLTLFVLVILAGFCGMVSYVAHASVLSALKIQIVGRLENSAFHMMGKIDPMLFNRYADIKVIASDPVLRSPASTSDEIRNRLMDYKIHRKTYSSLSFFDTNRVRIADTDNIDVGKQHPLVGYWKHPSINEAFVLDISKSESLNARVIHFCFPVKDLSGHLRGIVVSRMPLSMVALAFEEAHSAPLSKNAELIIDLVDKSGALLFSNAIVNDVLSESPIRKAVLKEALSGRSTSGMLRDIDGVKGKEIGVYVRGQGYLGYTAGDLILVLHIPEKIAFAPVAVLTTKIILVTIGAFVVSVIAAIFFSRTISNPTAKLQKGVEIVGTGNLDHRVGTSARDEIGRLSRAFDRMTERLQEITGSRNALKESQTRLQMALDAAWAGTWQWDLRSNVISWDNRLHEMFGYLEARSFGTPKDWLERLHPDDAQAALAASRAAVEKDQRYDVEYRVRHGDAEWRIVNDRGVVIRDEQGQAVRMVGMCIDITERKEAEEELRRHRDHLEDLVEKRTAQLEDAVQEREREIVERRQVEDVLKTSLNLMTIMGGHTIEEIMQFALDQGERLTGSSIGYFHFVNPDQETIDLTTWSQNTFKICSADTKDSHYPISQAGVWVDCIHQRRSVIHNDYENLSHKKGLPSGHVPVIRDLSIPVIDNDRIVAVFGVGNKEEDYQQTDIDRLSLLAENTWIIVQRKRAEKELQQLLQRVEDSNRELQEALAKVRTLSGFLPICSSCKKIRDDRGYWNQIETYIRDHSEAEFSHSICPECREKLYPKLASRK